MGKLERDYQAGLIKRIKEMFPGCVIVKNDSAYLQGFPDLTVFYGPHWAWLECKRSKNASHRPNQDYYIDIGSKMGFAAFIYPENEEEVLRELQCTFRLNRETCIPRCKPARVAELHQGKND